jgi:hypothetical protein
MTIREVCPFHADDDVLGEPTGNDDGSLKFRCSRRGHPADGPFEWLRVPEPPGVPGVDGLAAELGLAIDLPAAVKQFAGTWVEYGVVERAYALAHPEEFARIIGEFGHRAIAPRKYTASAFIARALGVLGRQGTICYHDGPATGRWTYNSTISWWSVPPAPDWSADRLSWQDHKANMSYVPGANPAT